MLTLWGLDGYQIAVIASYLNRVELLSLQSEMAIRMT
jgi:hypothetical protein